MDKEEVLKLFGLDEYEIKVYLALLASGSAKVNQIAKKLGMPRTTVYRILDYLILKGLVSYVIKSGIKHFETADPKNLLSILKEKQKYIEDILPELEGMRASLKEKPEIEVYEGKEGIKSIMDDLINEEKTISAFSSTKDIFNLLQYYTPNFIKRRVKFGIHIKLITEKTEQTKKELKAKDRVELRETRFIPKIGQIPNTIYIYGNKVAILNTDIKNPQGILIQNKNFAETQKLLFDFIWDKIS